MDQVITVLISVHSNSTYCTVFPSIGTTSANLLASCWRQSRASNNMDIYLFLILMGSVARFPCPACETSRLCICRFSSSMRSALHVSFIFFFSRPAAFCGPPFQLDSVRGAVSLSSIRIARSLGYAPRSMRFCLQDLVIFSLRRFSTFLSPSSRVLCLLRRFILPSPTLVAYPLRITMPSPPSQSELSFSAVARMPACFHPFRPFSELRITFNATFRLGALLFFSLRLFTFFSVLSSLPFSSGTQLLSPATNVKCAVATQQNSIATVQNSAQLLRPLAFVC